LDFGLWDSPDHMGGIILYSCAGSSSFFSSASSKMSLEKALGLALMQFCKATNGCTQSEPCAKGKKSFWHFIERLQIHFHVTGNVPGIEY